MWTSTSFLVSFLTSANEPTRLMRRKFYWWTVHSYPLQLPRNQIHRMYSKLLYVSISAIFWQLTIVVHQLPAIWWRRCHYFLHQNSYPWNSAIVLSHCRAFCGNFRAHWSPTISGYWSTERIREFLHPNPIDSIQRCNQISVHSMRSVCLDWRNRMPDRFRWDWLGNFQCYYPNRHRLQCSAFSAYYFFCEIKRDTAKSIGIEILNEFTIQ